MIHLTQLNELLKYMESNLLEEVNSKYIEQKLNLPYETLSRLFSSLTGMTLKKYFKYRRLSEAAKEIIMTESKVIDVAFKYGYESSEAFSYAFKTFHNASPTAVKKGAPYKIFMPINLTLTVDGGKDIKISLEKISDFTISAMKLDIVENLIVNGYDPIKNYKDLIKLLNQVINVDSVDLYEVILPNNKGVPIYYLGCQRLNENLEEKIAMKPLKIPAGEYMVFEIKSAINKTICNELRYILDVFFTENKLPYHKIQIGYYEVGERESENYITKMYVGTDVEQKEVR